MADSPLPFASADSGCPPGPGPSPNPDPHPPGYGGPTICTITTGGGVPTPPNPGYSPSGTEYFGPLPPCVAVPD